MQKSFWFGTRGRLEGVNIIFPLAAGCCDKAPTHLEVLVVPLELSAQALKLAAGKDGSAVLTLQLVLLLGDLGLSLLEILQLLLLSTVFFKLGKMGIKMETFIKMKQRGVEKKKIELFWLGEILHAFLTS